MNGAGDLERVRGRDRYEPELTIVEMKKAGRKTNNGNGVEEINRKIELKIGWKRIEN
ncbi:MAG: hypothetical protein NUW07_09520 [Candidatus Saccharicenans sp.]|jgi:hypothetical protein|nr:hypothetical protein [Candidatus Saccharicenans sp.]MDH7493990.1 hypothetical protein [Candidatus Saccharicenans sp.]